MQFIENGLEGDADSGGEEDEAEDTDGVEVEHLHISEEVFILSLYLNYVWKLGWAFQSNRIFIFSDAIEVQSWVGVVYENGADNFPF